MSCDEPQYLQQAKATGRKVTIPTGGRLCNVAHKRRTRGAVVTAAEPRLASTPRSGATRATKVRSKPTATIPSVIVTASAELVPFISDGMTINVPFQHDSGYCLLDGLLNCLWMLKMTISDGLKSALISATDCNGRLYINQLKLIVNRWPHKDRDFEVQDLCNFHPESMKEKPYQHLVGCQEIFIAATTNHCVAVNGRDGYVMDSLTTHPVAIERSEIAFRLLDVEHVERAIVVRQLVKKNK